MHNWIEKLCLQWIWGVPLLTFIIVSGIYFMVRSRFRCLTGLRGLKAAFSASAGTGIRPFEAFALTAGGKIGVGNVVGVSMALRTGGPGAVLWIALFALLGAAISYTECRTAAKYHGGPPVYLCALGRKKSAAVFSVLMAAVMTVLMPAIQVNSAAEAVCRQTGGGRISALITGGVLGSAFLLCVCFGQRKIARFSAWMLPPAAGIYLCVVLCVIALNWRRLPEALGMIWEGAFSGRAFASGAAQTAVSAGIRRGMFSCEAGYGIAPYAAAKAAGTPHQVGLVQGFAVLFDTLGVCTLTGIMLLTAHETEVARAFAQMLGSWSAVVLLGVLLLFAFTTLLSCGFTTGAGITGKNAHVKKICVFTAMTGVMICASSAAPALIWSVCDGACGVMAAINLAGLWKALGRRD